MPPTTHSAKKLRDLVNAIVKSDTCYTIELERLEDGIPAMDLSMLYENYWKDSYSMRFQIKEQRNQYMDRDNLSSRLWVYDSHVVFMYAMNLSIIDYVGCMAHEYGHVFLHLYDENGNIKRDDNGDIDLLRSDDDERDATAFAKKIIENRLNYYHSINAICCNYAAVREPFEKRLNFLSPGYAD